MMTRRLRKFWILWICLGGLLPGCRSPFPNEPGPAQGIPVVTSETREEHYARTEQRFTRALLLAPEEVQAAHPEGSVERWPLILQQCAEETDRKICQPAFGTLRIEDGFARVEMEQATVYCVSRQTQGKGRLWQELCYLWFLPAQEAAQKVRYRGYRVLLDDNGRGLIWESLQNGSTLKMFFVSEPFEADTRLSGKRPLPGRRYAVEPNVVEKPEVVVARLLAEEPVPMGPFVYLRQPDQAVSTLLCRCMETQVDSIIGQTRYQMVTMGTWADLHPGQTLPSNLELPEEDWTWSASLRWPAGAATPSLIQRR